MTVSAEMPRYQCFKKVHALKIKEISDNILTFTDHTYAPIEADREMWARYTPKPGDYYVVYEDGYTSFSPAKAFEEGYTRI
jgi:hypothetical protein